jgi:hypothetical protein
MANDTVVSDEESSVGGYMLTTVDNPFSPFTQWVEWYAYDVASGHHTCALLARIVVTSDELSYGDQVIATQDAIDEIVRENVSGLHRKILKER